MATTINTTNLDFESIKNNLKLYFLQKDEFKDYNFEASGLNNLLDVLAWNTHYNALTANFALNESYLNTAQLRSSIISLAENVGYIPQSMTGATAVVNLYVDVTNASTITDIPAGLELTATLDNNKTYTFITKEDLTVDTSGGNLSSCPLLTPDGSKDIIIYEGTMKTKTFIADEEIESSVYVIPDEKLDIDSVTVTVYDTINGGLGFTYDNIKNVSIIDDDTKLYILKESPNGYYELSFSDGTVLGQSPKAGFKIEVSYMSVSGILANGATVFKPKNAPYRTRSITKVESYGGNYKEGIESIRKNAPFQYAAQNRMVTPADYTSLILRNFGSHIKDIKSYGGEDALLPRFGAVYISIVFNDEIVDNTTLTNQIKSDILDIAKRLSVVSFDILFVDPLKTKLECAVLYEFNPKFTTISKSTIQGNVKDAMDNYFAENLGKFGQSFKRSNALTVIDEVDNSVLSSKMDVKMAQYKTYKLDQTSIYNFVFPTTLAAPDDVNYIIGSNKFYIGNKIAYIRNRLLSNTLEVINASTQDVIIDNVGSYNQLNGTVNINGLNVSSGFGNEFELKITAIPSNQSAINPLREDILEYDSSNSYASPIIVKSI